MPLADFTWQSLRWLPMAVVAGGIAMAATWWMYQPQLRLRSRSARLGLPLLRCAALLALAAALLKPVIHRPKSAAERGTLLLLLDRSASMNVIDSHRSPSQLIALADGLKLLPTGGARDRADITAEDIEQIEAQADRIVRAGSELDYARLADRGIEAAQARLDESIAQMTTLAQSLLRPKDQSRQRLNEWLTILIAPAGRKERDVWLRELRIRVDRVAAIADESEGDAALQLYRGSAQVRAACDRLAKLSRLELAKLSVRQAIGADNATMQGTPIAVYGFASGLSSISLDARDTASGGTANSGAASGSTTQPIDPTTAVSDLIGAVKNAVAKYPRDGVRGVILLSDGRQVGQESSVEALAAAVGNVPVNTVRMATATPPRDLAIVRTVVPSRAFAGETLTVRMDVRGVGIRDDVPVRLAHGDAVQTKTIKFTDDATTPVEFSLKLDKPGAAKFTLTAAPQSNEISAANNTVQRWVNVLSDKVRVAAVAQSAGRDFQFMRDALQRTAWVKLDESIAASPDARAIIPPGVLESADLVILEDAGPNLLTAEQWTLVRKLVTDRGGGVILVAGEAHHPAGLLAQPDAAQLLPFTQADHADWRNWAGEWPSLRPLPYRAQGDSSRLADALRLTDDSDTSLTRWQQLPAMFRLMAVAPLKPNTSALLIDAETKSPVMTQSRLGSGRVLFVGMTETWRWRYKLGQRDQDRFWLQAARQVSDEPYALTITGAGGEQVSLDADRLLVESGRSVRLRARVRDAAGKPSPAGRVQIIVKSSDGTTRAEHLNVTADGSGRYERDSTWPPGEYTVSLAGDLALSPRRGDGGGEGGDEDRPTTRPADRLSTTDHPSTAPAAPVFAPHPSPLPVGERELKIRVADTAEAEMANLAGDDNLLRRLAEATGGQSYAPEQLADLPAQLAAQAAERPRIAEIRLWDSPYLFAFVLACLGLEWAVRKQTGLA